MAPKTCSADSPPLALAHTADLSSKQSSLTPTHITLTLLLEQMALINARIDAQTTDDVVVAAAADI
jgi:hypothetical protein